MTKPTKWPVRPAKALIRLGGCPGWSESSLGAQIIFLVLSCGGSFVFFVFLASAWSLLLLRSLSPTSPTTRYSTVKWRDRLSRARPNRERLVPYRKNPKNSDNRKLVVRILKLERYGFIIFYAAKRCRRTGNGDNLRQAGILEPFDRRSFWFE